MSEISAAAGTSTEEAWLSDLSPAQRQMWFMAQIDPDSPAYNLSGALDLGGLVDVAALRAAIDACVGRQEMLRSGLVLVDGEPRQAVFEHLDVPLRMVDLTPVAARLTDVAVQDLIDRLTHDAAARLFNLERPPLVRFWLFRVTEERHVLAVVIHHLISDAWSIDLLLRELVTGYNVARAGRTDFSAPLDLQYADYAAWQRRMLDDGAMDQQLGFWRDQLADHRNLALPTDRPRPPRAPRQGALRRFGVDAALGQRLRALGRSEGVSLFTILLTGFNLLLSRYSGQTDVTVGTATANRPRRETHDIIGLFMNMLVLRTRLADVTRYRDAIARTAAVCRDAFDHQDVPFASIVEAIGGRRDVSRHQFFQVLIQMIESSADRLDLAGLTAAARHVHDDTTKFDLLCNFADDGDRITAEVQYATELWDEATIERLMANWTRLLDVMTTDVDGPVESFQLLDPVERDTVLRSWNETARPPRSPATIDGILTEQVRRTPDAVALIGDGRRWTYAELDAEANRIAHALVAAGVPADSPVGIHLERSADLVVAMCGVLKAGAAYLVLDPAHPDDRLRHMVTAAGVGAVLIRTPDVSASLPAAENGPPVIDLATLGDGGPEPPASRSTPDSLALVVYTSGSTGRPKGVGVPHRAAVRVTADIEYARIGPGDVVLNAADPSFDATTFEVWGALLNGATVAVVPADAALGPADLASLIREYAATVVFLTPTLFHQTVDVEPGAFDGVRWLVCGGEVLDPVRARAALGAGGPAHVVNGYGPTETATFAACFDVAGLPADATDVPIGRPIADTTLYVLDPLMRPLPPGVPGELYIGGAGVTRGYLGAPDLTAARYVPDPFGGQGGRLYRTGDLVKHTTEGDLRFVGRLDQQLKLHGHRIEPGEVMAALRDLPDVRDCAVLAVGEGVGRRLAAYVVPAPGMAPTPARLREALLNTLPQWMTPSHFVLLDRLPLTASGKVDQRSLPPVTEEQTPAQTAPVTPPGDIEHRIRTIWRGVLGVADFGVHDDFFLLGGQSLLATTMIGEVREEFGVELSLRGFFETPTVAGLCRLIQESQNTADDELDVMIAELERNSAVDTNGEVGNA